MNYDTYRRSLRPDVKVLVDRYRLDDLALKVVGVGSVGTRCFIGALTGHDADDVLFLQVKEAVRSVLEPYLRRSRYKHQGERVVTGQRLTQSASDIFLGWSHGPAGGDFYWRQLARLEGLGGRRDHGRGAPAGLRRAVRLDAGQGPRPLRRPRGDLRRISARRTASTWRWRTSPRSTPTRTTPTTRPCSRRPRTAASRSPRSSEAPAPGRRPASEDPAGRRRVRTARRAGGLLRPRRPAVLRVARVAGEGLLHRERLAGRSSTVCTSGSRSAACAMKRNGARRWKSGPKRKNAVPGRWYVPQWMGTTRRGRSRSMALTACRGLMCLNSGISGPMPAMGSSARSRRSGQMSAMPGEEPRVAGEVHAARPRDDVAETRGPRRQRVARPAVLGLRADDLQRPDAQALARAHLVDVLEPAPAQREAGAHRRDDRRVAPEQAQRARVVVVEVQVGDEDHVRVGERLGERPRHAPVQRPDQPAQHGVGDDAHAVHLDHRRGVTEEGDARPGRERAARRRAIVAIDRGPWSSLYGGRAAAAPNQTGMRRLQYVSPRANRVGRLGQCGDGRGSRQRAVRRGERSVMDEDAVFLFIATYGSPRGRPRTTRRSRSSTRRR